MRKNDMKTYLIYYSYLTDDKHVYKRTLRAESLEDAINKQNTINTCPFKCIINSCVLIDADWDLVSDIAFEVHKYIRDNED